MEKTEAVAVLDRLHEAQNMFYGGGDSGPLAELLATDIVWTVPGNNRIAGCYRGLDEVFGYFRRRRDLASKTFRMHRKDILVGDGEQVAALTDGTATIGGRERRWSAVGLYTITTDQRIAACRLLPLDPNEFDAIW
jgi:ketosteroid isomerase-like protein